MADILDDAKEHWREASDYYQEERERMREDLRFSNPAKPEQWTAKARAERVNAKGGERPCLTLDYTNQFIAQVVNDARQNKPGINVSPADGPASHAAANALEGMIRQIEYESRATIAYDRGIDHAARCGRGWLRVGTKVINPKLNWQQITINSVLDPLSVMLDVDHQEPDGSDSTWGFVEKDMSLKAFKRHLKALGKKDDQLHTSWGDGVIDKEKHIRLAEYFYIVTKSTKYLAMQMPNGAIQEVLAENREQFQQQTAARLGFEPQVLHDYQLDENSVKWVELSGTEVLDQRDFPCRWIPLVPVLGHELMVDGKKWICGLTRQLMDAQRVKNYERSTWVEVLQMQPRVPWVIPFESVEGFEDEWAEANRSNKAFLPYNALDEEGNALPAPQRQGPPIPPVAFQQGSLQAMDDMQASVGMYRSNFGAPSNSVSGKAKLADQREGDTATFHYVDNLSRAVSHVGRICVDMIRRIKDTRRDERTLAVNGSTRTIRLDPQAAQSYQDGATPVLNPRLGEYNVRVKTGPAYSTVRQEAAESLNEVVGKNPQLMPILGPLWAEMQDWPQADKVAKLLLALAPKPVQDVYNEDMQLPPEAQGVVLQLQGQLEQAAQQIQEMGAAMQEMQQQLIEKQTKAQIDLRAAEAKEQKDALDAEIRMGELALKERELGLREREMAIRELEAMAKVGEPADGGVDEIDKVLEARKVEIQAYEAETARMKVHQDGLVAQQKSEHDAASLAMDVANSERDREAQRESEERQAQQQREQAASDTAAKQDGEAGAKKAQADQSAVILAVLETLQQTIETMAAQRNRAARITKLADGTWQMESVDVSVESGEDPVQELEALTGTESGDIDSEMSGEDQ